MSLKFDIHGHRMLAAHKTDSEIVSPGRREQVFLYSPMTCSEVVKCQRVA